jgi:hypothetical protein
VGGPESPDAFLSPGAHHTRPFLLFHPLRPRLKQICIRKPETGYLYPCSTGQKSYLLPEPKMLFTFNYFKICACNRICWVYLLLCIVSSPPSPVSSPLPHLCSPLTVCRRHPPHRSTTNQGSPFRGILAGIPQFWGLPGRSDS